MDILKLIETLTDRDSWPGVRNPDQLKTLDRLSQEAFARGTLDGTLASVLITHQICDELIKQLIRQCRFVVHLSLAVSEFEIQFGQDDGAASLDKLMTGQLIAALDATIEFEEKQAFLSLCKEMSEIRNRFAHQLARQTDLAGLRGTAEKYHEKYAHAFALYEQASDTFECLFKDHRKDDSWDFMLKDILEEEPELEYELAVQRVVELRKAAGFGVDG